MTHHTGEILTGSLIFGMVAKWLVDMNFYIQLTTSIILFVLAIGQGLKMYHNWKKRQKTKENGNQN